MQVTEEATVLRGMTHRIIEIGSGYGVETNVEKTRVIRIQMRPSLLQIMVNLKHV